ncbi:MAG: DNA methyltransferase [Microthrixaceae bacterium]
MALDAARPPGAAQALLAPNGSIWVHLDDAEVHRCRVVMDEVLGAQNFIAEVVWQKVTSPRNDTTGLSGSQDYILAYSRKDGWSPNRMKRLASSNTSRYKSRDGDPVPWRDGDATAGKAATNHPMVYAIQHPVTGGLMYPTPGRCWGKAQSWFLDQMNQYAKYELRDIGDEERRATICATTPNEVKQGVPAIMLAEPLADAAASARARHEAGHWPELVFLDIKKERVQRKKHLADAGRVPETLWLASDVGGSLRGKNEVRDLFPRSHAFATPKPEQLLQRIIHIASDPGDLVLDCFAGSGTTAAVAHKMGRRWVTVEREQATVESFTKPRLTKVVSNDDPGGVTSMTRPTGEGLPDGLKSGEARTAAKALKALFDDGRLEGSGLNEPTMKAVAKTLREVEKTETEITWQGGGGFRHVRIGPSMFDLDVETGDLFLAEWATNGAFSEAVAAQLGFEQTAEPPFCGQRGRTRLAVLDGVVGAAEVEFLIAALDERERVIIVGQAFTEEAEPTLRTLSPGSRVRHAPQDLLRRGGRA